jgi:hypothetical protein
MYVLEHKKKILISVSTITNQGLKVEFVKTCYLVKYMKHNYKVII